MKILSTRKIINQTSNNLDDLNIKLNEKWINLNDLLIFLNEELKIASERNNHHLIYYIGGLIEKLNEEVNSR